MQMTETNEEMPNQNEVGTTVSNRLAVFLFLGFTLVIVGIVVVFLGIALSGGTSSFSGVIFIGPFPIVIGAGPDAAFLIIVALVISALSIAVFVLMRRRRI